ncbi:hypothetical protein A3I18_02775 [Candidatus Campbellbacteria bacterium RIFCSPLOWO2_02_FULL_35_11]|uniref:Uncharacterized protein n=2 Tax=Candidatus Campbelliibacteriota TaxID=1752727 RepID=A0A1F5EP55_9BACT|nr:MAG: hypothetical protein A3E89_00500 [Candidatus Campbellbacteria bacterium RIFCSPHIGHO2_12_FULL_35_10]OGD70404.1 MAG: hypothetical protein A3I18_02775 [Candidatus Campbellbacteria bacterium RIFCSPLOWO2_02_FULL_35_11]
MLHAGWSGSLADQGQECLRIGAVGGNKIHVVLGQNSGREDDAVRGSQTSRTLVGVGRVERDLLDLASDGNQGDAGRFDVELVAVEHDGLGVGRVGDVDLD